MSQPYSACSRPVRRLLPVAWFVLSAHFFAAPVHAADPPPFVGTWKIDPVDAREQLEAAGTPADRIELTLERMTHQSFVFSAAGDWATVYNGQPTVAKWTQKSTDEESFELQIDHPDGRTEPLTVTMLTDSRLRIASGPRAFLLYKTSFLETWEDVAQLAIGSPAPPLAVEHWLQDDVAARPAFANYEPGQIYVLECWATWCPPCVTGVPDLAALQHKYRDQGVTVLAVSNEPLARVEGFLARELAPALAERAAATSPNAKTFGDVTREFRLAADPDGSTWRDYLAAVGVAGVPTVFLIGRTGQLEWIGGPDDLAGVLDQLLAGTWDREAYHAVWENQRRVAPQISRLKTLVAGGAHAEALAAIDELLPLAEGRMRALLEDLQLTAWAASGDARAAERLRDPALATDIDRALAAVASITQAAANGPLDAELPRASHELLEPFRQADPRDLRPVIAEARLRHAAGNTLSAVELLMEVAARTADPAARTELAELAERFRAEAAAKQSSAAE